MCVSDAVYDPDSKLRLPKGTSTVQGEQALSFVRTRHAFGDGGDLGRIKAQQGFLSSLTRKIKDDGTLTNPARMLGIADAITKNLTIDDGLASVPTLLTVANRLKDIDVRQGGLRGHADRPGRIRHQPAAAGRARGVPAVRRHAQRRRPDGSDREAGAVPERQRHADAQRPPHRPTTRRCSPSPWPTAQARRPGPRRSCRPSRAPASPRWAS